MNQMEPGHLTFSVGPGGVVEITRADPVVECTEEFLRTTIGGAAYLGAIGPLADTESTVDMITFSAANRSVTYRIGKLENGVYRLNWPD